NQFVQDQLSPALDGRAVEKSRLRPLFTPRCLRSAGSGDPRRTKGRPAGSGDPRRTKPPTGGVGRPSPNETNSQRKQPGSEGGQDQLCSMPEGGSAEDSASINR